MTSASERTASIGTADLATQYAAARGAVVLADRSDLGRVRFTGKDAADLLHRLSTNAVKGLAEGAGVATVFTTSKGRILDLVTLHRFSGGLFGLCAAGRSGSLLEWVERYTFREQVAGEDWTASHRTYGLHGPHAAAVVARLGGEAAAALPTHGLLAVDIGGTPVLLVRTFPLAGDGFLLTAEAETIAQVRAAVHAGAGEPIVEADAACLEILRIEAGLPGARSELTEDHNPWEARLQDAISLSKGCYVGQEVVARLDTYKKVARQLVRVVVRGRAVPGDAIAAAGGEEAGIITSSALVPDDSGRVVALGYVRTEDAVAGRSAVIKHAGGTVPAVIEGVAR